MKRLTLYMASLVFVAWAGVGCSGVGFSQAEGGDASAKGGGGGGGGPDGPIRNGNVPIDTTITQCTIAIQNISYPLKLIFVVDASGSNKSNPGTDKVRQFRVGSLKSFYEKMKAKSNFGWQMIHFQNDSARTYIKSGNTPFFGSSAEFSNALDFFIDNVNDTGFTPYKAAMSSSRTVLQSDATETADTKYAIFFMSDGMPTDTTKQVTDPTGLSIVSGPNGGMYDVVDEQALINDVMATVGVKASGKVTLSTVYYGENNTAEAPAAKLRLKNMSIAGGGKFVDASLLEQIRIEDSIGLPGLVCTP